MIHGKHPGETISSLLAESDKEIVTVLKDMLDPRLPAPMPSTEDELLVIFKLAIACLSTNPQLRPSMKMVSQVLSAHPAAHSNQKLQPVKEQQPSSLERMTSWEVPDRSTVENL